MYFVIGWSDYLVYEILLKIALSRSNYLLLVNASFIMVIPSLDDSLMKAVLFNSVSRTASISLSFNSSPDNSTLVFVAIIFASINGGVTAEAVIGNREMKLRTFLFSLIGLALFIPPPTEFHVRLKKLFQELSPSLVC